MADIRVGSQGRLKEYQRKHQKFPLLLPMGPQDKDTTTFKALAAKCMEPKTKMAKGTDWISMTTWSLIAKRMSLKQSGQLNQAAARRMKGKVNGALKADKQQLTADVGENIVV